MYDPFKSKNRWVRIGSCLCEDTPELRALLRQRDHPRLEALRRWLVTVGRLVKTLLKHF